MYSLHPFTAADVRAFVEACQRGRADSAGVEQGCLGFEWMRRNDSRGPALLTSGLALFLAERSLSFVFPDTSLTKWEATIERGIGMYLRPPSRLFVEAGVERTLVQGLPVRLDASGGVMGGAHIPAHLVGTVQAVLEARLGQQMRRLAEAEIDAVATMGLMLDALQHARDSNCGLFEAADVAGPEMPGEMQLIVASRNRLPQEVRKRLEDAARPPGKPGLFKRVFGVRGVATATSPLPDDGSADSRRQ